MIEQAILRRLEAEQVSVAKSAVERPQYNEVDYGRLVGTYQGLEMARQIILDVLADNERRERES